MPRQEAGRAVAAHPRPIPGERACANVGIPLLGIIVEGSIIVGIRAAYSREDPKHLSIALAAAWFFLGCVRSWINSSAAMFDKPSVKRSYLDQKSFGPHLHPDTGHATGSRAPVLRPRPLCQGTARDLPQLCSAHIGERSRPSQILPSKAKMHNSLPATRCWHTQVQRRILAVGIRERRPMATNMVISPSQIIFTRELAQAQTGAVLCCGFIVTIVVRRLISSQPSISHKCMLIVATICKPPVGWAQISNIASRGSPTNMRRQRSLIELIRESVQQLTPNRSSRQEIRPFETG